MTRKKNGNRSRKPTAGNNSSLKQNHVKDSKKKKNGKQDDCSKNNGNNTGKAELNNNNIVTNLPSVVTSHSTNGHDCHHDDSASHHSSSSSSSEGGDHSFFGDDDYNSGMYRGLRGRRYCLSSIRFFGLAIFLWSSQYVVSTSMKHLGVLVQEGDEIRFDFDSFDPSLMAQKVIPQQLQRMNWNSMFNDTLAATYYSLQSQRPGYQRSQEGAGVHSPVVIIPGFVTSGLEVWTSRECAKRYFRQRIWTGIDSARALFTDKNCWREHVALDPYTGKDPDGIKLRAAQGFSAADYFMGMCVSCSLCVC